jgi:hypothetical protein
VVETLVSTTTGCCDGAGGGLEQAVRPRPASNATAAIAILIDAC